VKLIQLFSNHGIISDTGEEKFLDQAEHFADRRVQ